MSCKLNYEEGRISKVFMLMPLTGARWKAAPDKPNVIIGEWAEDYGSTYEIKFHLNFAILF